MTSLLIKAARIPTSLNAGTVPLIPSPQASVLSPTSTTTQSQYAFTAQNAVNININSYPVGGNAYSAYSTTSLSTGYTKNPQPMPYNAPQPMPYTAQAVEDERPPAYNPLF